MDPESLFCMMLQNVYNTTVALIETAVVLPLTALQILQSALQMIEFVVFAAIDIALTALEQLILKLFDLENASLENARRNFCKIAYACVALTNYLFGSSSPLRALGFSQAQLDEMKNNYSKFEEIVCQGSFKSLLDQFKNSLLVDIDSMLSGFTDQIDAAQTKIDRLSAKYQKFLLDSGIYDYLGKLDEFAQCAFTACNFIATGENKKSDVMDKLKLSQDGENYNINSSLTGSYYALQGSLTERIASLRSWSQKCANRDPNPNDGIPLDKLA